MKPFTAKHFMAFKKNGNTGFFVIFFTIYWEAHNILGEISDANSQLLKCCKYYFR
jgi:hypothetical protein